MGNTIYHLMLFEHLKLTNKYSMIINNRCLRCGNTLLKQRENLLFCDNCKEFGYIYSNTVMYQNEYVRFERKEYNFNIDFTLSELQLAASKFILNNIQNKNDALIWAVCGAGKTEITFAAIHTILKEGKYIAFAITRVDIVYEIYERLNAVFTNANIGIMTGKIKKNYNNAQIFVLTTNQLLRFKNAFSLIIIDEVDAFPFEYNSKFDYAVNNSKREDGTVIYLTSTPSENILSKKLNTFKIYKRWHNFDLPVPTFKKLSLVFLNTNFIHPILYYYLQKSNRQCLIFISNIEKGKQLERILLSFNLEARFTYSNDEDKINTIKEFKNNHFKYLISTTILERGVTFEDIDVFVIDTSSKLYNLAALVQIAGRARRKKDYQDGRVIFFYQEITDTMVKAKNQITNMNYLKNKKEDN